MSNQDDWAGLKELTPVNRQTGRAEGADSSAESGDLPAGPTTIRPWKGRTRRTYPGQEANAGVRVIGIVTIVLAAISAIWLVVELGDDPLHVFFATYLFLNGLVGGLLLVVFGAIGENLIGIRRENEIANAIARQGTYEHSDTEDNA